MHTQQRSEHSRPDIENYICNIQKQNTLLQDYSCLQLDGFQSVFLARGTNSIKTL